MSFFREMLARVKERENLNHKNKPAEEKIKIKSLKEKIAKNARSSAQQSISAPSASAAADATLKSDRHAEIA